MFQKSSGLGRGYPGRRQRRGVRSAAGAGEAANFKPETQFPKP